MKYHKPAGSFPAIRRFGRDQTSTSPDSGPARRKRGNKNAVLRLRDFSESLTTGGRSHQNGHQRCTEIVLQTIGSARRNFAVVKEKSVLANDRLIRNQVAIAQERRRI